MTTTYTRLSAKAQHNLMESGYTLVTVEVEEGPAETYVMLLEAAAGRADGTNAGSKKIWGSIEVAPGGVSVPYCGGAGGKTHQRDDEIWKKFFPEDGVAKIHPEEMYTLSNGADFELGRDAAIREFHEETLGVWKEWWKPDTVRKEIVTGGGYSTTWKNPKTGVVKEYRSQVTVLHLHFVLPHEVQLINLVTSFLYKSRAHARKAHHHLSGVKNPETSQSERYEIYQRRRPEYQSMFFVPADQYFAGMKAAVEHLHKSTVTERGRRRYPYDGRLFWIDTRPGDIKRAIALRKWDVRVLMLWHAPYFKECKYHNPQIGVYLEDLFGEESSAAAVSMEM